MQRLFDITNEPEIWKDIKGYEHLYQVSNLGRVKSLPKYSNSKGYLELRKEKVLKPYKTGRKRNYLTVRFLDGKAYKVHRLVAEAFIPNPDNLPQVNHKDENPSNNNVDNLEWCTNAYNVKYSAKPLTDERKEFLRSLRKGKKLSDEHRQKISIAITKYYSDEANRQKQSKIITDCWRNRKCKTAERTLKQ